MRPGARACTGYLGRTAGRREISIPIDLPGLVGKKHTMGDGGPRARGPMGRRQSLGPPSASGGALAGLPCPPNGRWAGLVPSPKAGLRIRLYYPPPFHDNETEGPLWICRLAPLPMWPEVWVGKGDEIQAERHANWSGSSKFCLGIESFPIPQGCANPL